MGFDTTIELRTYLQEEVNDTSPDSTTQVKYVSLLDRAHRAVIGGGGELNLDDRGSPIRRPVVFPWAVEATPKILTLLPFQEGSADVTQLSNSVPNCTINSSATDLTGWHVRFSDDPTVYYVSTHSSTTLTLDSAFVGTTGLQTSFEVFKLRYTLGSDDILLLTDTFRGRVQVPVVGSNKMQHRFPLTDVCKGSPTQASIVAQSGGTFTIQFSHYVDELLRLEIPYVKVPVALVAGSVNPIIPNGSGHRVLIAHLAAFYHLRRRDDDRAKDQFATAKNLFDALVTESLQNTDSNDPSYGYVAPWPGGFDGESFGDFEVDL